MKNRPPATAFMTQASEALINLLHQVSWIRPQDVRLERSSDDVRIPLLAHIQALGRSHTLACALHPRPFDEGLDAAIFELYTAARELNANIHPVLIATHLSAEAQRLCRENRIAYIDLRGNARIDLGEVFIARLATEQPASRLSLRPEPVSVPASVVAQVAQATA